MALPSARDEEKLAADLAKIRAAVRMRLGALVGLVGVGLFQIRFPDISGMDMVTAARTLLSAALPVLTVAVAGAFLIVGLARRDTKRKQAEHESKQFRIPVRSKRR